MDVKNGTRFMLFPRPQIVNSAETIHVFGACVACGELLESTHVVGTFMLSCRHQYHPLCFSVVLHSRKSCAKLGCDMVIPEEARSWINGIYVVKSKYASVLHDGTFSMSNVRLFVRCVLFAELQMMRMLHMRPPV